MIHDRNGSFLTELRRRRVPSVTLAYLLVAWGVIEVSSVVFPEFGFPEWSQRFVIVVAVLGIPIVLVLAWAYDLTLRGPVRTPSLPGGAEAAGGPAHDGEAEQWQRMQARLLEVLDAPGRERDRRLQRLDREDPAASAEVESLLSAHDSEGPVDELMEWLHGAAAIPDEGATVGRYTLQQRLGGGGMGVVYRALDERLGRAVALKFLAPSIAGDPGARERFLLEARTAATLDHPNIGTILEVGETERGQAFLAMPFYEGETLKARIERGPLPPDEALDVAAQVGRGLAAAHERGIIHRDIKPANILLTRDGAAKIVDFGIAKVADVALTKTGAALGTVGYMSPEQTRGETVDHRTDLWSLGVILFEMLTGAHPFPGRQEEAVRDAILHSPHPSIVRERPEIAGSMQPIVDRALAKDRDRRYASAGALVADLESARAGVLQAPRGAPGAVLPEGERRMCTVLVASIAGYDELLDELSPDAFAALFRRVEAAVVEAVSAEGGIVLAVEGKRFEAAFGIPVTHEDDARRAVRAGLQVCERVGTLSAEVETGVARELAAGVGLDSGRVAARRSDGRAGAYQLSGPPVRVAGELARRAIRGGMLVTRECLRLAGTGLDVGEALEVDVAGEEESVPAYTVMGEGPELPFGYGSAHRLTEFLGRSEEMTTLEKASDAALAGAGVTVEIVGEPGVGKSRLLYEFSRTLSGRGVTVLTGRCQPVGRATSYGPIAQVLREFLSGDDGRGEELDPERAVDGLLALDRQLGDALPLILQMLALEHPDYPFPRDLKGDQLRVAVAEAVAGLFSVLALREPLVFLLEDWHWADEASNFALLQIAQIAPSFPLLIAVTYRPGYGVDLRPAPSLVTVRLGPVGETTVADLLVSVLDSESVDPELVQTVSARTGGNPFFIEEVAADLLEQDAVAVVNGVARVSDPSTVRLPDSIQAVIRTRLDRVDPAARGVLFAASVIGREFSRDLLHTILGSRPDLDRSLQALQSAGLIQQTRVIPEPGYRFKHALTQEVTYESLLAHQRRELHRKVGEVLELRRSEADEGLDLLAHHFGEAGVWAKAVRYGLRSAQRSTELSENGEALALLGRAERWAENGARDEEGKRRLLEVLLAKERLLDVAGDRAAQRAVIQRIRPLAEEGSESDRGELALREGDFLGAVRRYDEAEERLREAIERSRAADDHVLERKSLRSLGLLHWHKREPERALPCLEEALEIDRRHGDVDAELGDLFNLMNVLRGLGEHERAIEVGTRVMALAEGRTPMHFGLALHGIAQSYRLMGRADDAIRLFEEASQLFGDHRLFQQRVYAATSLANLHFQMDDVERALQLYQQAIDDARRVSRGDGLAVALKGMADVLEATGRGADAIPLLEEAQPLLAQLQDPENRAAVTIKLASLYGQVGRHEEAIAAWGTARELARELDLLDVEIIALEGLATSSRLHFGQGALAVPLYEEAVQKAGEVDDPRAAGRLLNSLGVIAWDRQDFESARRYYGEALEAFRSAGHAEGQALVLASLGAVHQRLGEIEAALGALEAAVEATTGEEGNLRVRGYALGLLGDVRKDRSELDLAEAAYTESLSIREQIDDRRGEGWMLLKLAEVEERRGALDRVRELSSRAYEIAAAVDDSELMQACTAQERY